MGQIKLPSGGIVTVDELQGHHDLTQIIRDLRSTELTDSFLISVIGVLGRLGNNATTAVEQLESLAVGDNVLLKQAAQQALKKINAGVTTLQPTNYTTPASTPSTPRHSETESWSPHPGSQFHRDYTTPNGTIVVKKPDVNRVAFAEIPVDLERLEDGTRQYTECRFCGKLCLVSEVSKLQSRRLAGNEKFYCTFCLRNNYYSATARDTFILSYRGLFGYYYYAYYIAPKNATMYLVEIKDMIDLHVAVGSFNPLMHYDAETFCWFIDFGRVGKGRNRIPLEAILATVSDQLACFNIYDAVRGVSPQALYAKIQDAMLLFMNERQRKWGNSVFSPTLFNCGIPSFSQEHKPIPIELLQTFVPAHLLDNHGVNKNRRY